MKLANEVAELLPLQLISKRLRREPAQATTTNAALDRSEEIGIHADRNL
jgi:hypothetical protein